MVYAVGCDGCAVVYDECVVECEGSAVGLWDVL